MALVVDRVRHPQILAEDESVPPAIYVRLLEYAREHDTVPVLLEVVRNVDQTSLHSIAMAGQAVSALNQIHRHDPLRPEEVDALKSAWESDPVVDIPLATRAADGTLQHDGLRSNYSMVGRQLLELIMEATPMEENDYFVRLASNPQYQGMARAIALKRLRGWDPAERALIERLYVTDSSGIVRAVAGSRLANLRDEENPGQGRALRELMLEDPSPEVRQNELTWLQQEAKRESPAGAFRERLAKMAENDADPFIRRSCSEYLQALKDNDARRETEGSSRK
ncbi:MAG: hypothetical protein HYY93_06495 [Planctomycetes bacterium]|nr:hypothetical protein [Planctomycetota bacterium]